MYDPWGAGEKPYDSQVHSGFLKMKQPSLALKVLAYIILAVQTPSFGNNPI